MPTDDWERGYAAGYRAAHRTDVRDITSDRGETAPPPKRKRTRTKSKRDGRMSRALKEVNKRAKKKNGDFKKGWNQSRVMRTAHDMVRRMR